MNLDKIRQKEIMVPVIISLIVTVIGSSAQQATQQQLQTLGTAGLENVYVEANQQLA